MKPETCTVTFLVDGRTIRAENHTQQMAVCIAVTASMQLASRILHAGKALGSWEVRTDPPFIQITADPGDPPPVTGDLADLFRDGKGSMHTVFDVMKQQIGRSGFIKAVFDGMLANFTEIAKLSAVPNSPMVLEIIDERPLQVSEPISDEKPSYPRLVAAGADARIIRA